MPIILDGTAGISTPAVTYEGNVVITGTGRRILGDFSNATIANRVVFQTSTTNGNTGLIAAPNGTSVISGLALESDSALTNSSTFSFTMLGGNDSRITSGTRGSGTALPLTMFTGGSERVRINTNGNITVGATVSESSSAVPRLFVVAGSNNNTTIQTMPCGLAIKNTHNEAITGYGVSLKLHLGAAGEIGKYGAVAAVADGTFANSVALAFYTTSNGVSGVDNVTERMRIDGSGNVGINRAPLAGIKLAVSGITSFNGGQVAIGANTTYGDGTIGTPSLQWNTFAGVAAGAICIANGTGNLGAIFFRNPNGFVGNISTNGSSTLYNTSSDYRLKENVAPMTGALVKVVALKPVTYNWKVDGSAGQGFIAHELQEVIAEAVTGEKDQVNSDGTPNYQSVDTSFLVATLTAAIQEQQSIIETLKSRLDAAGL